MNDEIRLTDTLKRSTAFLPIAMSFAALALVLVHVAMFGAIREPDEGAAAHIWQILILEQVPIVALFAAKRFSQAPRVVLLILTLQAGAALAAIAPVWILHL